MGLLSKLIGALSGETGLKVSEQLLFDKVIGFKGIVPGVGTSTVVQNVAHAITEKTDYAVCVLDTSFLFPIQYPLLKADKESLKGDYLDFTGELTNVIVGTGIKNVYLASLTNRGIVDMFSSRDSAEIITKLISSLKSYFDIILVDLSYELTYINSYAAIKSNKIFYVADQSLKCVYNMRKSINMMATLGIPPAKANKVILNKVLPDVNTNTRKVLEESGLKVLGEIPFSLDIAKHGVAGKLVWGKEHTNKDLYAFSTVINKVVEDIVEVTPKNRKYIKGYKGEKVREDLGEMDFQDMSSVKELQDVEKKVEREEKLVKQEEHFQVEDFFEDEVGQGKEDN